MSYTIPIGPYHPSLEEPIHASLTTEGELITDADVYVGYNHRGIEKLAREKNFIQTITLVERVCGICSHSHGFAYCMALEEIAGMEVPKRGQYIRVIISELERLHSHLLWLGIACHNIGHDSMFMHIFNQRELIMDCLEALTGNRVNYGMNTVGGARRDIDPEKCQALLNDMKVIKPEIDRIADLLTGDRSVAMRTQGVGVLTKEQALELGAAGPHARASGVDRDVRRDAPYSSYEDFDFLIPLATSGDVYARVLMRVLECYESIKIIEQAVSNLPEGPINLGNKLPKIPAGEMLTRHEAPRGQLIYKVVTDGGMTNYRLSIHVPTFKNAPTLPTMLKGNTIADAGLIIASIDPCFSCLDR